MKITVQLDFIADDDTDCDAFGEAVLCAIERSPDFFTDGRGLLRLAPQRKAAPPSDPEGPDEGALDDGRGGADVDG